MTTRIAAVQQQLVRESQELTDTMRTTRAEFERRLAKMRETANDFIAKQRRAAGRSSRDNLKAVKP